MSSIDERIVDLKFNNKQFEEGVRETRSSLAELEGSLRLENLDNNIGGISKKISALGVVGAAALANITNSAIGAGQTLLSHVLDPLIEGGKQRALNIEQAKFQLQGLGLDVKKVMGNALDAVRGTAFGLDSAAKAAAMFGASGISAGKEMTNALRGISGVAALTSSSYDDIANVFTKVAGQGRLMGDDLNRLGTRGMNAAATLGKALGKTQTEIRDMVSDGKISFKTFAKVMNKEFGDHATKANETYTGSLSNVRAALGRIGAAFAESKFEKHRLIFNGLIPVIDGVAKALEPMAKLYKDWSLAFGKAAATFLENLNVDYLIEVMKPFTNGLRNIMTFLGQIKNAAKDAFKDIFPPSKSTLLLKVATIFEDITKKLILSEKSTKNLRKVFAGFFAIFGIGWEILKRFGTMFGNIFRTISEAVSGSKSSGGILELSSNFSEFITGILEFLKTSPKVDKFFAGMEKAFYYPAVALAYLIKGVKWLTAAFTEGVGGSWTKANDALDKTKTIGERTKDAVVDLGDRLELFWGRVKKNATRIRDYISNFVTETVASLKKIDVGGIVTIINQILLGGVLLAVTRFINTLRKAAEAPKFLTVLGESIQGFMDRVGKSISRVAMILSIAFAIGVLAGSLYLLSKLSPEELKTGVVGIAALMTGLVVSFAAISKTAKVIDKDKRFVSIIGTLLGMSVAILILVKAVEKFGKMDTKVLKQGGLAVAGALTAISAAVLIMTMGRNQLNMLAVGLGIIAIAAALEIFRIAIERYAAMDMEVLKKGGIAVATAMGAISASVLIMSMGTNTEDMLKVGVAIVALVFALDQLRNTVDKFGKMDTKALKKGGTAVAAALAAIVITTRALPKDSQGTLKAMTGIALAIASIAGALKLISTIEGKKLFGVTAALVSILAVVALMAAFASKGMAAVGDALIKAAVGIALIAGSIFLLSKIDPKSLLISVAAIGYVIAIFAALVAVLTAFPIAIPVVEALGEALLMLGGAIALIGLSVYLATTGLANFINALVNLSSVGKEGAENIRYTLEQISAAIPVILVNIANGLIDMLVVFGERGEEIRTALVSIFTNAALAIQDTVPVFLETVGVVIDGVITFIDEELPKLISMGMKFLVAIANGITADLGPLVAAGVTTVTTFINELSSQKNMRKITDAAVGLVGSFVGNMIASLFGKNAVIIRLFGKQAIQGIVGGISLASVAGWVRSTLVSIGARFAANIVTGFMSKLQINSPSKLFMQVTEDGVGEGIAMGGKKAQPVITKTGAGLAMALEEGFKNSISSSEDLINGEFGMDPVIKPVLDLTGVKQEASLLDAMLTPAPIGLDSAFYAASDISKLREIAAQNSISEPETQPKEIVKEVIQNFHQTNTSPESLSEIDIYRQSKNLLQLAKEELSG